MAQAEWGKPEPCPKIARAAMLMRKFQDRNRYAPLPKKKTQSLYSEVELSINEKIYTAARDLLLKAAGKVGTKEERAKEKEDISLAVELLLVLLDLKRSFHLPSENWPPKSDYEPRLERLKYAGFVAQSSSLLEKNDIKHWPIFITKLNDVAQQDQPNPGKTVWNLLSQKARSLTKKLNGVKKVSAENRSTIIKALNNVLKRRDLYRQDDYSTVALSQEAKERLSCNRDNFSIREVRQLNRLLIEPFFSLEIEKSRKGDINDWGAFCEKLTHDAQSEKRHPGKAIWKHLPPTIRRLMGKAAKGILLTEKEEGNILEALNEILERRDFYQEEDFSDISFSKKVQDILDSPVFKVGHIFYWERFIVKLSEEVIQDAPSPGKTLYEFLPDKMQSLVRYSTIRPPKHWEEEEKSLPDNIKSLVRRPLDSVSIIAEERRHFVEALNRHILGSSLFTVGDILDWPDFCSKLTREGKEDSPSPGKIIWNLFPSGIQSLIEHGSAETEMAKKNNSTRAKMENKYKIVSSLNTLINRRNLYEKIDGPSLDIPVVARELLACDRNYLSTQEIQKLNRFLIETIYPCEIVKMDLPDPRDFYKEQDYSTEDLPETVRSLLARDRNDLSPREIQKLNRLLLEAAYPGEISESEYFSDDRENWPLREVSTLNRLLIEAAYPKEIVPHEKRDFEIDIISEEFHYPLWWIYQAREITETNRSDKALQDLYDEYRPDFEKFVRDSILSKEDGILLTRDEVWYELERACWEGIQSFSSGKGKSPEDYIVGNHMAFVTRRIISGRGRGSAHFRIRDIIHWTSLLLGLDMAREIDQPHPEKRIWMLLPQAIQALIEKLCSGVKIKRNHKSQIIKALNDILDTENLYHEDYFTNSHLPEDIERDLNRSRSSFKLSDIRWFNRKIIENVFQREIESKQDPITIELDEAGEIPTTPDMPNEEKEYIRNAALLNINMVCKEDEKPILMNMLEVVLDQVFGGEIPSGSSIFKDERITISESSVYTYFDKLKNILLPIFIKGKIEN